MTYRFSALILVATIGTVGCEGGQSGGELGLEDGTGGGSTVLEGGGCKETPSVLALDETSPLGFSAEDILGFATGTHEATMTYSPDDQTISMVNLTPDSGTTTVAIVIESKGSTAFVVSEPDDQSNGGLLIDMTSSCQDFVSVDVTVHLTTGDGAFGETLDGRLVAHSASQATLTVPLDLDSLEGTFEVEVLEPKGGEPVQTTANVVLGPGVFVGEITGMIQLIGPDVAQAGGVTYGEWGYGDCETGTVPVGGDDALTGDALLDVLNGSSPLSLTWGDGTATELNLAATAPGTLCVELADPVLGVPGGSYHLTAEAALATTDGRLDTNRSLHVQAETDAGALTMLSVTFEDAPIVQPDAFEATFGLSGVEFGDHTDISMWLGLDYSVVGDSATAEGELSVVGIPPSDCVPTDNSSCGSPGQQPIEVAPISTP